MGGWVSTGAHQCISTLEKQRENPAEVLAIGSTHMWKLPFANTHALSDNRANR